jgi:protein-S-isoprenylcysteine O-methyltransferase Ste14
MTYTPAQRSFALLCGVICHVSFFAAVGSMLVRLYLGLQGGISLSPPAALGWDLALLVQFPLFHSLLLTPRGGRVLDRLIPLGLGTELRTTTFATVASLQLLLVFLCWAPLGPAWFAFHGMPRLILSVLYLGGWILLAVSMANAGLGIQMGYLGWWAVFRNRQPAYPAWNERGTLKASRHPMYLAYTLLLWTGPVWSIDHALMAGLWTLYCVLAPLHKESRYLKRVGQTYREYQQRVPYFLPRISFRNSGA